MLKDIAYRIRRRLRPVETPKLEQYTLDAATKDKVAADYKGDLARIFFGPKSRLVDKWLHYLDMYERHFAEYRGRDLKFLEIGVFKGGSLEMWRRYFGPAATIYGLDIDPECAAYETEGTKVRIGSQADPEFLASVVAEMGAPDIILDDGSHIADHQEASFRTLFPLLKDGGLYVIEDLHSAYWTAWRGGYKFPGSAIELVKAMIDDMHGWYHNRSETVVPKDEIGGIHIYDSMVFIEKKKRGPPVCMRVPGSLS